MYIVQRLYRIPQLVSANERNMKSKDEVVANSERNLGKSKVEGDPGRARGGWGALIWTARGSGAPFARAKRVRGECCSKRSFGDARIWLEGERRQRDNPLGAC